MLFTALIGETVNEEDNASIRSELTAIRAPLEAGLVLGSNLVDLSLEPLKLAEGFARANSLESLTLAGPDGHVLYSEMREGMHSLTARTSLERAMSAMSLASVDWSRHEKRRDVVDVAILSPLGAITGHLVASYSHRAVGSQATCFGASAALTLLLLWAGTAWRSTKCCSTSASVSTRHVGEHYRQIRTRAMSLSVFILVCALGGLAWNTLSDIAKIQQMGAYQRAQQETSRFASQIENAVALGIPVEKLGGVTLAFQHRIQAEPALTSLSLVDKRTNEILATYVAPDASEGFSSIASHRVMSAGQPNHVVVARQKFRHNTVAFLHICLLFAVTILAGCMLVSEFLDFALKRARRWRNAHTEIDPSVAQYVIHMHGQRFTSVLLATTLGAEAMWLIASDVATFGALSLGALIGAASSRVIRRNIEAGARLAAVPLTFIYPCLAFGVSALWPTILLGIGMVLVLGIGTGTGIGIGQHEDALNDSAGHTEQRIEGSGFGVSCGIFSGALLIGPVWGGALFLNKSAPWAPALLIAPMLFAILPRQSAPIGRPTVRRSEMPPLALTTFITPALIGIGLGLITAAPSTESAVFSHPIIQAWGVTTLCAAAWLTFQPHWRSAHGMGAMLVTSAVAVNPWTHPIWVALSLAGKSVLFCQGCHSVFRAGNAASAARCGVLVAVAMACAAATRHAIDLLAAAYLAEGYAISIMGVPLLLAVWVVDRWSEWQRDCV